MIRLADDKDCTKISVFHKEYINKGFLSSVGIKFLNLLYKTMISSKNAFCVVYENEGEVVGFVSGATSVKSFYREFIRKNFLYASFILLPKIINLKILKKTLETLLYPTKEKRHLPDAELLSIVVDKEHQGKKIAQQLFYGLVKEFSKRGVNELKVVVGSSLPQAVKFYEKMGGKLAAEIEVHDGEISRVYTWKTSDILEGENEQSN